MSAHSTSCPQPRHDIGKTRISDWHTCERRIQVERRVGLRCALRVCVALRLQLLRVLLNAL
eukprot:3978148-Prymnesium_polylepis.3